MTLLRQMRAEMPRPDRGRLVTGRERLLTAISQEAAEHRAPSIRQPSKRNDMTFNKERDADASPLTDEAHLRSRTRRRPVLRMALAAAAAVAVAATGVSVLDDGAPGTVASPAVDSPRMQPVNAASVLNAAAVREREHEKAVAPRGDQFIYTKETVKETERRSGTTKSYVDENWRSVNGSQRSWVMEIGKGWWAPPKKRHEKVWPPADWDSLAKLPTDPEKLILAVRTPDGPPKTQPKSVAEIKKKEWPAIHFALAGLLYRTPVMPEGLRPAAFEALAKIPGITATPGVKDAKGRAGIAVSYKDDSQEWTWSTVFIFAKDTHEFLGFKSTRTSDSGGGKTYDQLSSLDSYAVVDKVKQRP
ncbi:CU044_5270 family protein [Streptomyces sp. NPDC057291]|uniref:CU044_5270 family protein n=1 Tax=Streptomyces sp. NPDC057291 TaxID=3346087 RepID=UPI00363BA6D1